MTIIPTFEYRKLGDFAYHVLTDPGAIKSHLMRWIMQEWEQDHNEASHEHWTVEWMRLLPGMEFSLETVALEEIRPHPRPVSDTRKILRVPCVLRGKSSFTRSNGPLIP